MPQADPQREHQTLEEHSKLFRDLLLGFIKVHLLYHASREPIYGSGMMEELERHGYHLSPGTLYPVLHGLEKAGFLEREDLVVAGKVRKYYQTTALGTRALDEARGKVVELVNEIMDDDGIGPAASKPKRRSSTKRTAGVDT